MAGDVTPVVLLFGAGGQVGRALIESAPPSCRVVSYGREQANFENPEALRDIVRAVRPSIIINAAAYTAVDRAESEEVLAARVNADAPAVLAQEAEALGAMLVHYSTDYVFDGTKATPYAETDSPAPLSVYGRTKLAGEENVRARCRRHLVFRTSWVMSPHGQNFLKTILRLARERPSLKIVADQFGAPTPAALIAATTWCAIALMREAPPAHAPWGLYHLAAQGETSWHGYARRIVEKAASLGAALLTMPDAVYPIAAADYPAAARRPASSRLDTTKLRTLLSFDIPHWTEGVDETLRQIIANETSDQRDRSTT